MIVGTCDDVEAIPFMPIEYVVPEHSNRQVDTAGEVLRGKIPPEDMERAVAAFAVAYNWRDAHVLPMRRIRFELAGATKRVKSDGIVVARLKRMKSIRRKLTRSPLDLGQIQDIGGCRTIVETIAEQTNLIKMYSDGFSKHNLVREWAYISKPRATGYRSHHIVLKFNGVGDEKIYNRLRIEAQIRTRLQHVWATAVEAAGLVRREDLKGGEGHPGWLRLFALMASEIADLEESPGVPGVPDDLAQRRDELRAVNAEINAASNLAHWNNAVKDTEKFRTSDSSFYVVQYDPETQKATVEPMTRITQGSALLVQEEQQKPATDTVLIELDKVEDLRAAYPNYFLDVRVFTSLLGGAVKNADRSQMMGFAAPVIGSARSRPRTIWRYAPFGRWLRSGL